MRLKSILVCNSDIDKFVKSHKVKPFAGNDIRLNKLVVQSLAHQKYNGVNIIELYDELSKYISISDSDLTIANINTNSFLLFVELINNRSGTLKFNNDNIWRIMNLDFMTRTSFLTPVSLMKKSKYYIQFFTDILPNLISRGFIHTGTGIYEREAFTVELTKSNSLILFNAGIKHEVPLTSEFILLVNRLMDEHLPH